MKLIICEKPKVAQKMAEALSDGKVERKAMHGVPYYHITRGGDEIYIAAAVGHIYTLRDKSGAGYTYPVFDIEWAPSHEVDKDSDYTKGYLSAIESLAKKSDEYVCACDYDIEGSLIGYNVIRFACNSEKGKRMKFSALTQEDLVGAYEEMGELDYANAKAGEVRHMLDWFWGINLSRALMAAVKSTGRFQVMSIGRVQGPALAILVEREKEISAFKPTPFWLISAMCKGVRFEHTRGKFEKKEEAQSALSSSLPQGTVQKIERKEYNSNPYPPFDLTSLQVEAYRHFGFSPKHTQEMAQTLYEASLISYPRTSSQKLPAKLNLQKIISSLSKSPQYEKPANSLILQKRFTPLEGKKEDPAHPAIHPTGILPAKLGERETKLYDLIAKRFLSCFAEPARRESQKVEVLSGTQAYFATGNRTVFSGWFDFYAPYVKLEETTLPPFAEGESVLLSDFKLEEKKTQPPKRYTEASIISELEDRNLGTKSTRAVVIETLHKRGYVEAKSIKVTAFGMSVHAALSHVAPEILDEQMTRQIEEEMDQIQTGGLSGDVVLQDGKSILSKILEHFKGKEKEVGAALAGGLAQKKLAQSLLGKCPLCKTGDLRSMRSARTGGQFVGCSNYPNCRNIYPLPRDGLIEPLNTVCAECQTPQIKVIRRGRKPFTMCIDPKCKTKADWGKPKIPARQPAAKKAAAAQARPKGAVAPPAKDGAQIPVAANAQGASAPMAAVAKPEQAVKPPAPKAAIIARAKRGRKKAENHLDAE
jgi:DNA topoisomerase-1